jgi:hypothetical protein
LWGSSNRLKMLPPLNPKYWTTTSEFTKPKLGLRTGCTWLIISVSSLLTKLCPKTSTFKVQVAGIVSG